PQVAAAATRTVHLRDGRLSAEGASSPVLVLDDHGWIRLPETLRSDAALGARVRAVSRGDHIELWPAASDVRAPVEAQPPVAAERARADPLPVRLTHVDKRLGDRLVIDGVTRTFGPGALHALAGASGSGKTTLLQLI